MLLLFLLLWGYRCIFQTVVSNCVSLGSIVSWVVFVWSWGDTQACWECSVACPPASSAAGGISRPLCCGFWGAGVAFLNGCCSEVTLWGRGCPALYSHRTEPSCFRQDKGLPTFPCSLPNIHIQHTHTRRLMHTYIFRECALPVRNAFHHLFWWKRNFASPLELLCLLSSLFLSLFFACHVACGVLVLWPGTEALASAVKAQS